MREQEVRTPESIITIRVSKYLTDPLARKIAAAQWNSSDPEWVHRIRRSIYGDSYFVDCFGVVATNQNDEVIGRLYCIQNEHAPSLWYYGDLFVIPDYRRRGIATRMLRAAMAELCERGARTLRAYVSPGNEASMALQRRMGFTERTYETFNDLLHDDEIMLELELRSPYTVIPVGADDADFVMIFYKQNIERLHGQPISLQEWKDILSAEDEDEQNFLICRGCMPVAWLRVNGLMNSDMAWLSMLVVSDKHQRQGVGRYAVAFAEDYVRQKGFGKIAIHTTEDNIPAQNLYRRCGYEVTGHDVCEMGDGVQYGEYTFVKAL